MKNLIKLLGLVLIIAGLVSLIYQGINYNKEEQIAKIGSLEISATTQKTLNLPPYVGGAAILVGLILVVAGRRK